MTGNLSNTIDAFDNQDQTSGRDLLYIKPKTLPYTHHDNMIWSSSYNHFNILVRGIKKMEIIVVCHILFEIYLIIVEFHPTITMKYNCTLGQLTCAQPN